MNRESRNNKDDSVYIDHMLECIQRINEYVDSRDQFFESHLVQDAVVRNLQVMAESSQRLSQDTKNRYPGVPWKNISGFRNILAHDYLGTDLDMIWSVIEKELAGLKNSLIEIQNL